MESTTQSDSESSGDNTSVGQSEEQFQKKNIKLKRRKSTISAKKIKDRIFCVIFCCFNNVRNTRSRDQ